MDALRGDLRTVNGKLDEIMALLGTGSIQCQAHQGGGPYPSKLLPQPQNNSTCVPGAGGTGDGDHGDRGTQAVRCGCTAGDRRLWWCRWVWTMGGSRRSRSFFVWGADRQYDSASCYGPAAAAAANATIEAVNPLPQCKTRWHPTR